MIHMNSKIKLLAKKLSILSILLLPLIISLGVTLVGANCATRKSGPIESAEFLLCRDTV